MQTLIEHRSLDGGMNCDASLTSLGPGEYFNGFNFRAWTSETGAVSGLQSIPGTTQLLNALPAGTNYCMGAGEDENLLWVLWFNWNSLGSHGIYAYDTVAGIVYTVLLNAQVTGGLNLDRFHYVHSCFVLNGNFYWTDNLNEPRRLNIAAAIKMNQVGYATTVVPYTSPMNPAVIAWIRRQPGLPPTQNKVLILPIPAANFIAKEAFEFAWRYQYKDFELSTLSAYSNMAPFNEEDSPPTQTFLTVTTVSTPNIPSAGKTYLRNIVALPGAPTPAYGASIKCKLRRAGTSGSNAVVTDIPIVLNWSGYPGISYTQVILNGLTAYFLGLPTGGPPLGGSAGTNWFVGAAVGGLSINLAMNWDWGIGDTSFPPTTECNMYLYSETPVASKQFSRIDVTLPLLEKIDQDVIRVDMVAKFLSSNTAFIIKSWMTAVPADAVAIAAHNAGTTALAFQFFNNTVGIALTSAYTVKPFDSVPIQAQTIERAKNKTFMGGCLLGYSSPLTTSLALSYALTTVSPSGGSGGVLGEWNLLRWNTFIYGIQSHYVLVTMQPATGQPPGYAQYFYSISATVPPFPSSVSSGITFLGFNMIQAILAIGPVDAIIGPTLTDQSASTTILSGIPAVNYGVVGKAFKSGAPAQVGIKFLDNSGRKCGEVTNAGLTVNIPNTGLGGNQYVQLLNWTLSNALAAAEIPVMAYYYSIDITKCLRTRSMLQGLGFISYASKDNNGNYTFTNYAYSSDFAGIAINLSFLVANHMGYTFNAGDVVNFMLSGTYYTLAVLAQSGSYIVVELANAGSLSGSSPAQFEIFTPYKPISNGEGINEPFFEQGEIYQITNPGQPGRQYSATSGTIGGDVFLMLRNNFGLAYIAEAMSPNDKYYLNWFTNAGRATNVDTIGQASKTQTVVYSNPFIQGSKINGLSTFDALDSLDLSQELGNIQKLILTSKIQKEGSVMLAICSRETVSLYLGETQIAAPQGNAFLSISVGVIGTVYPLKGSLGTMNPESVCQEKGVVFWLDARNGGVAQYSENGLELVSRFGTRTFWRRWCAKYSSMTQAQVAALGSQPFVIGGIDSFNGEYLLSLPQIEATNPNGTLPGYTTGAPQNLFNVYDGMAKTMAYKYEKNKWVPAYSYCAEALINVRNQLFGFKAGLPYLLNDTTAPYNTFFGVAYPSRIMLPANAVPDVPKMYKSINAQSDSPPTSAIVHANRPNPQITDISKAVWTNREGVYYSPIYRDRLSPAFTDPLKALVSGDKVISKAASIQINFGVDVPEGAVSVGYLELKYVNIGYELSKGHKTTATK